MTDTTFYCIMVVICLLVVVYGGGPSTYMLEATGQLEELSK